MKKREWICILSLALMVHCGTLVLTLNCNISEAVNDYISNLTQFAEKVSDMEKEDRNILPPLMECEHVNHRKNKKR